MIKLRLVIKRSIQTSAILMALLLFPACQPDLSTLNQVKNSGVLTIISHQGPSTFFIGHKGLTGFEYELAKKFADSLGVRLRIVKANDYSSLYSSLNDPEVHLAAASLVSTDNRKESFSFSLPYLKIEQQVIYKSGTKAPRTVADLINKRILVVSGSHHVETLNKLQLVYPELKWIETAQLDIAEQIQQIQNGYFDFTLIDSNEFVLHRALFPNIDIGFSISQPLNLAWAFPKSKDNSLEIAAKKFLLGTIQSGELAELEERFYGHINAFNYSSAISFLNHIETRLPRYTNTFKKAAEQNNLDWRLLAAIGYQESLWNPSAVSPTGVRGLMMLTRITAKEVGVTNRVDPQQSINGGAIYFRKLIDRLPQDIDIHHKIWFSLAAYNGGYGHVSDARIITEQQGANPDDWFSVKERLPLLQLEKWSKNAKHGHARATGQALVYVRNIRKYYDLLVWATEKEQNETLQASTSIPVLASKSLSTVSI